MRKGECGVWLLQGGVTPIEPIQTFPTGGTRGFDHLDRPLTPNLGGVVTFSHGLMHFVGQAKANLRLQ